MLRFTIRDLLWLMVVVGLSIGWWLQENRQRDKIFRHEVVLDEISASGIWTDGTGRILTIGLDANNNPKIIQMQRNAGGQYVPGDWP